MFSSKNNIILQRLSDWRKGTVVIAHCSFLLEIEPETFK